MAVVVATALPSLEASRRRGSRMPRAILAVAVAALWSFASAKPKKGRPGPGGMPGGMPNIPGMGGLGGGPPWRTAVDKVFSSACANNGRHQSVFCFPDKKELLEALKVEQFSVDPTGEMFLTDLHVVVDQLLQWPPAWRFVEDVLDPSLPRTKAFCDKLIGSPWWNAIPLIRRSFITPRNTLMQVSKSQPVLAAGMKRWMDDLRKKGDAQTRKLLDDFDAQDAADTRNATCRARPLMRLMQHVHAKVVHHIMGKACKGSAEARKKFETRDANGLTLLHHAASMGDAAAVKAILRSTPKAGRAAYAAARDNSGYTAADWAALGDFEDVLAALRAKDGSGGSSASSAGGSSDASTPAAPTAPVRLFPAAPGAGAREGAAAVAEGSEGQCAAGAKDCASDEATGAWSPPDLDAVPSSWLRIEEGGELAGCDIDVIDASQFDLDVFLQHYVLHPRPLVIRGGASFPEEVTSRLSRAGLLKAAGDRSIRAERFAGAEEYDGSRPVKETLRAYAERLDGRRTASEAAKKLHYLYTRLPPDEPYLNFTATLPNLLAGKVELTGTYFHMGGSLMGLQPQHRAPVASSLMHGARLWILEPPGREIVVHEAMLDFLKRSDGLPRARRCLQRAGDLVLAPRRWSHGALCLGGCLGIDHEFTHEKFDLRDQ